MTQFAQTKSPDSRPSLTEYLEYMQELSSNGLAESPEFDMAHIAYVNVLLQKEPPMKEEIKKAKDYLAENTIQGLNSENMIEHLEKMLASRVRL